MGSRMRVVFALTFISTYLCGISEACDCGRATSSRVINGTSEESSNFPWMARIFVFFVKTDKPGLCGATMISTRYAVTAGHCNPHPLSKKLKFHLVIGEIMDPESLKSQKSNVKRFIVKTRGEQRGHDIAVVETTMDMNVPPICLPPHNEKFVDVQATLLGYGETETGESSPTMLAGNFTVPSNAKCHEVMDFDDLLDTEICGGNYGGGPAMCTGDSGGPLMYYDKKDDRWFLIGVVEGSYNCTEKNIYGYFTRVTSFLDWIHKHTDNAGCQPPL